MTSHYSGGKIRRKLDGDVVSRAVFGGVQGEYRYLLHRTRGETGVRNA